MSEPDGTPLPFRMDGLDALDRHISIALVTQGDKVVLSGQIWKIQLTPDQGHRLAEAIEGATSLSLVVLDGLDRPRPIELTTRGSHVVLYSESGYWSIKLTAAKAHTLAQAIKGASDRAEA